MKQISYTPCTINIAAIQISFRSLVKAYVNSIQNWRREEQKIFTKLLTKVFTKVYFLIFHQFPILCGTTLSNFVKIFFKGINLGLRLSVKKLLFFFLCFYRIFLLLKISTLWSKRIKFCLLKSRKIFCVGMSPDREGLFLILINLRRRTIVS